MRIVAFPLTAILIALSLLMPARARGNGATQQPKRIKNVILMITDGTSLSAVSLARWYQRYLNPDLKHLAIDPHICGTVITYSSNAPIGDSAPTTSCYMTGVPSQTSFISTYPPTDGKDDLVPLDTTRAYSPLITLMETARLERGMRTGIVVTCQFPHATPADCAAHYHDRGSYGVLASQMARNGIDVLIGGGTRYLDTASRNHLVRQGYALHLDSIEGLRRETRPRFWALFGSRSLPMDMDRDTARYPSLAESTRIAIEHLSKGPKGFFLMVEGSMVDWAAHANDPVGIPTELLAFDRACRVALDFARTNGETAVIITADHGNSGLSIGRESWPNYDEYSAHELFGQLVRFRMTATGMAGRVKRTRPESLDSLFQHVAGFTLTAEDRQKIYSSKEYKYSPLAADQRAGRAGSQSGLSLQRAICQIYTARTPLAFTTHGHTAEEVFLAAYHPDGHTPRGAISNVDLHRYMATLMGYPDGIDHLNRKYFVPHTTLFPDLPARLVSRGEGSHPALMVQRGKRTLIAEPNSTRVTIDGVPRELGSLVIYSPRSGLFYLPESLRGW